MAKRKKRVLLEVYLEDNSIQYDFNDEEEEIIIANNLLIHGILGKIQKHLLDLDSTEILEETEEPENLGEEKMSEEDEVFEGFGDEDFGEDGD